jgi:hypothetical protein
MVQERSFIAMLTPNDRYRHSHARVKGNVVRFIVQYETKLEGKWFPVVRYDTRHGFAHRDVLDKKGNKRKTPIFVNNFNEALTFAEYDIRSNW